MKPADSERLLEVLDDVLDESADLRARSLDTLLREARRRQQARRRRRSWRLTAVVALILAGGAAVVLWRPWPPEQLPVAAEFPPPPPDPTLFVRSGPLPVSMLIETGRPTIPVVRSSPSAITQLSTALGVPLREIGDGELFTLLAGRPAALVRVPSGQAELLLLDEAGRGSLPVP